MGNNNQGWNWNWEWKWDWNGAKDSMKEDYAKAHHHTHRKTRRHRKIWPAIIMFCIFGRPLIRVAASVFRSLARGFSSGISALFSVFTSAFRATSGTAVLGGLIVGVIIGLYVYKHKFGSRPAAADEEEEPAEEKEPAQVDPVPIPMTLGNTPSSSDEEYVPQAYNTFGN